MQTQIKVKYRFQQLLEMFLIIDDEYNWRQLSLNPNPNALHFFQQHVDKLCFRALSKNDVGLPILLSNPTKINWKNFSRMEHPNCLPIWKNNLSKLSWFYLSSNPVALPLLLEYPEKIDWYCFSRNLHPDAIKLLSENLDKVDWSMLSNNLNAFPILCAHPDKIEYRLFNRNPKPEAVAYLASNLENICWDWLAENKSEGAIALQAQAPPANVAWSILSLNPFAMPLLKKNLDKINTDMLSSNSSNDAIDLLEGNIKCINWSWLSYNTNPRGLQLFLKYSEQQQLITWSWLASNPALFELDYIAMSKERTKSIEQELLAKALHPIRVGKWLDAHLLAGKPLYEFEY